MTNTKKILAFLAAQAPKRVTNSEIKAHVVVRPHQQVFQITQRLMNSGQIRGARRGGEWEFWVEGKLANEAPTVPSSVKKDYEPTEKRIDTNIILTPTHFEKYAGEVMSQRLGKPLRPGKLDGVPKQFDLVSDDRSIVGDAKYYTMVAGERIPPAKFSVIAEYVWILEKTRARQKFLVFGHDDRVPKEWLIRYGQLVESVDFYFLSESGELTVLWDAKTTHRK